MGFQCKKKEYPQCLLKEHLMFKRRDSDPGISKVTIDFEGQLLEVNASETVSAALMASGVKSMRTTDKDKAKRAPYCQMGVCFECLVEINGRANQQGCMTKVEEGMKIRRQVGKKDAPE